MLRCVSGGHEEEITVMAYDFHLSLIATGCVNGEIIIYDFEMSKILGIMQGDKGNISCLHFMSPFPLLLSASTESIISIWGVRPIQQKYLNVCIKRYKHVSWDFQNDIPCYVSRILVWHHENTVPIQRYRRVKENLHFAHEYREFK